MKELPAKEEQRPKLLFSHEKAKNDLSIQIKKGENFLETRVFNEKGYQVLNDQKEIWVDYTTQLLEQMFTTNKCANDFKQTFGHILFGDSDWVQFLENLYGDLRQHLNKLRSIYERIDLFEIAFASPKESSSFVEKAKIAESNKVFIVHGHDESAKRGVESFLRKMKLDPIILHDVASSGRTIIEKVEHNSDVAFSVVILTPDDIGNTKTESQGNPRARQNVIFELGFFIGKLGRKNVCCLYSPEVELPSDMNGVVYVPLDINEGWHVKLAREMKAAGLNVDMNLI